MGRCFHGNRGTYIQSNKNRINKVQNVNYIRWIMNTRKERKEEEKKGKEKEGKEREGKERPRTMASSVCQRYSSSAADTNSTLYTALIKVLTLLRNHLKACRPPDGCLITKRFIKK